MDQIDRYQTSERRPPLPKPKAKQNDISFDIHVRKEPLFAASAQQKKRSVYNRLNLSIQDIPQSSQGRKKRVMNENYDIDDPVHVRNYPKQVVDEALQTVKTRERALIRQKVCSAEIRQRAKLKKKNPNSYDEDSQMNDDDSDSIQNRRKVQFNVECENDDEENEQFYSNLKVQTKNPIENPLLNNLMELVRKPPRKEENFSRKTFESRKQFTSLIKSYDNQSDPVNDELLTIKRNNFKTNSLLMVTKMIEDKKKIHQFHVSLA